MKDPAAAVSVMLVIAAVAFHVPAPFSWVIPDAVVANPLPVALLTMDEEA